MDARRNFQTEEEYQAYLTGYERGAVNESRYPAYTPAPRPKSSNSPAWAMVMLMFAGVIIFGAYLAPDILAPGRPEQTKGSEGNQAPGAVRGTFQGKDTRTTIRDVAPAPADQVQADIDKYNADQQAQAQEVLQQPAPLPLNSAGEPVISQEQLDQQALSLQLAEQEANAAADQALAAQREAANADAASRAPDVSYEDAKALLGRDPCHVPRANPATCAQGLFKPTPIR